MFKFSDKPLALAEIMNAGLQLYKDTFKNVWFLVLTNMLLFTVIFSVLNNFVPLVSSEQIQPLTSWQIASMWVCNILMFIISAFFFSLILHRIYILGKGEMQMTLKDSVHFVIGKYLSLIAITFIFFAAVIISAIVFIIPGIIVGIFLAFSVPLVLIDNMNVFAALKESVILVWKNWWRTLIVIFPVTVALLLLNVLAQYLFSFIFHHIMLLSLVNAAVMTIGQTAVYSFLLVQYNDLKLRKTMVTTEVETKSV